MAHVRRSMASIALLSLLGLLAACGSASNGNAKGNASVATSTPLSGAASAAMGAAVQPSTTAAAPRVQGQLTVFAAASLTDAFKQIGSSIEQANPGAKISFNFAGSPTLRTQLAQGARADVFAAADEQNMQGARQDGSIAGEPRIFAQNRLVVIVPVAKAAQITRLQDLAKPGVKVVLEQQNVPAGNYARQALAKMSQDPSFGSDFNTRVQNNVVSQELNVRDAVAKVQLGEADAAFVYTTDVTPAVRNAVKQIEIPDQFNVIARYPIAVVKGAPNADGARAFIDYVLSPAGQAILREYGFILANG